ncbi:RNA 5'-monophosphate methyltransferase [Bombina bombina]|uniref:RNA 5'-monophosphate methyltransferase n=1 Tax=Bombina bombina TaxID=8345 RepID=UPI00235B22D6|nr:RNA 5'-monophosphate methyltransferase [Bombina bombina]
MEAAQPSSYLDPGAAPYGNFPNYYSFHPPETRVSLLPPGLLRKLFQKPLETKGNGVSPVLGLDVGCNTGELSVALYRHLQQQDSDSSDAPIDVRFLCCDMDSNLIARAELSNPFPDFISYMSLDIMDNEALQGPIHKFLEGLGRSKFDIGFCMSVTMWIHLHHGDQGLVSFLHRLAGLCDYLLIEPQPWKCYRSAARRLRKLGRQDFQHFHTLSIRGDMAEKVTHILTSGANAELIHSFGNTSWDRSLLLFKIKRGNRQL